MLNRLRASLYRFMAGRYGYDQLSYTLIISAFVISVIGGLFPIEVANVVRIFMYVLMFAAAFRVFSKKIRQRQSENRKFMDLTRPIRSAWKIARRGFKVLRLNMSDKSSKHYLCPNCSQIVRVPKGRGLIEISCPHCRTQFTKRT